MVDEHETDETEQSQSPDAAAPSDTETTQRQRPDAEASSAAAGWQDLDAYCEQLRAEHAGWSERMSELQAQLAHLQPALLGVATQHRLLAIEDDLERLNQLVLGGAAMAQSVRLAYDLERFVSLLWPAAADPRPSHAREGSEGEYRIDIALHVGPDGRGRIRVEGEKRLEAPLPTSRERLRTVLLRAIQAPKYVDAGAGSETGGGADDEGGEGSTRPAALPAEESSVSADERREVGTDQPVPEAEPRPGDPDDQPPPEEQVIPLGPASDDEPKEPPKRRGRKT